MTIASAPQNELLERPHILVVDDDKRIRELLGRYLVQHNFLVTEAEKAATARELIKMIQFDIIVLDIMMPGEDGLNLTKSLQQDGLKTPILLLTAKAEAESRIEGLEAGADDYLSKPFEPRELVLRLQSILRRSQTTPARVASTASFGGWVYDATRALLTKEDETQILTKAEATLLNIMLQKPGDAFTREELANLADLNGQERTIDVQVTRLRRKIEPNAKKPRYLQTVRGEGYILHTD